MADRPRQRRATAQGPLFKGHVPAAWRGVSGGTRQSSFNACSPASAPRAFYRSRCFHCKQGRPGRPTAWPEGVSGGRDHFGKGPPRNRLRAKPARQREAHRRRAAARGTIERAFGFIARRQISRHPPGARRNSSLVSPAGMSRHRLRASAVAAPRNNQAPLAPDAEQGHAVAGTRAQNCR